MKLTKNDILFYAGFEFAVWFAGVGMVWSYYAALYIAYPFGALSLLIWAIIRKENRKRTRLIPVILSFGLLLSLSVLIYLLIWD